MYPRSWRRCIFYASLFSLGLLLVSVSPSIRPFLFEAARSQAVRSVMAEGMDARPLQIAVTWFALVTITLHLLVGVTAVGLTKLSEVARISVPERRLGTVFLWFAAMAATLMLRCAVDFPRSHAGGYYGTVASYEVAGLRLADVCLFAFAMLTGVVASLAILRTRSWQTRALYATSAVAVAGLALVAIMHSEPSTASVPDGAPPERPHLIVIGIDSLRSDVARDLTANGQLPHLRTLLRESTWFSDATTPLARTFPAWISILTGRAPSEANVVCNLTPRELVKANPTVASRLGEAGYHTVFATDEVRFSNIDESYGFDQAETPAIGAADFLIPQFSDIPLINLVANTPIARELFPQLYANRAVTFIYQPETFVARLRRSVRFDRPTFLAVHLTAPHWPYVTAHSPARRATGRPWDDSFAEYLDSVKRADGQLGELMSWLRDAGALESAVVVVLSDHGEALYRAGDSLVEASAPNLPGVRVTPAGHGTSVLSGPQFQVLLGFRGYGPMAQRIRPGISQFPVALEDIAPTLAEFVGLDDATESDGISLATVLRGDQGSKRHIDRSRYTETGFNVISPMKAGFDAERIAAQGAWH